MRLILFDRNIGWKNDKGIYWVCSLFLFGLLFGVTYQDRTTAQEPETARIVLFGDSIMGECRDETSVSALLSEQLGETVFNGALGGTCMGRQDESRRLAFTKDSMSMQSLSQSIVTDDFGVQQTVRIRENATEYFDRTIDALDRMDFYDVDILFISHGINDYHAGIPIDNEEDPYDVYTFNGALRSVIGSIQKKYPHIRIILITPLYSWYPYHEIPELTCEEYDLGGGILEDYVEAEILTARSMGVEIIDLYHDFLPHEQWSDWEKYSRDGLHPNEAGRSLIAARIYEYLTDTDEKR